jgi:hypothetical protein
VAATGYNTIQIQIDAKLNAIERTNRTNRANWINNMNRINYKSV